MIQLMDVFKAQPKALLRRARSRDLALQRHPWIAALAHGHLPAGARTRQCFFSEPHPVPVGQRLPPHPNSLVTFVTLFLSLPLPPLSAKLICVRVLRSPRFKELA